MRENYLLRVIVMPQLLLLEAEATSLVLVIFCNSPENAFRVPHVHINRHKSYSNSSIFNRVSSATILLLALIAKCISRVCMHQHKSTKPKYFSLMHTVCLNSAGFLLQCMSMRLTIEWPVRKWTQKYKQKHSCI